MGSIKKMFFFAFFIGGSLLPCASFAQTDSVETDDILLLGGTEQDFVLPSYFEGAPTVNMNNVATMPSKTQQAPSDVDILQEIFGENLPIVMDSPIAEPQVEDVAAAAATDVPAPTPVPTSTTGHIFYPQTQVTYQNPKKEPLLTPLPPLPELMEPPIQPRVRQMPIQTYSTKLLAHEMGKSKVPVTLPRDMRLQFAPDSSQLSQAILKWITAYALHVQKDPRLVVSLRVSQHDWNLQQARLSLIVKTLMQRGLSVRQIKVYRSDRDADTLVLGYMEHPDQTKIVVPGDTVHKLKEQKNFSW